MMYRSLCLCALVPHLETRTRLVLIIHRYEARKPTNTGRLAASCLASSEIHVRGHEGAPSAPIALAADALPLLLFPAEGALPLTDFAGSARPVTLIVPDGTWRQASRVRARVPGLAELPCVTLPAGPPTRYRLRAESRPDGLATIEAIARAMGILEGAHVQDAMERLLAVMVERTRGLRGTS
jgi:DTW domain-containing protein